MACVTTTRGGGDRPLPGFDQFLCEPIQPGCHYVRLKKGCPFALRLSPRNFSRMSIQTVVVSQGAVENGNIAGACGAGSPPSSPGLTGRPGIPQTSAIAPSGRRGVLDTPLRGYDGRVPGEGLSTVIASEGGSDPCRRRGELDCFVALLLAMTVVAAVRRGRRGIRGFDACASPRNDWQNQFPLTVC